MISFKGFSSYCTPYRKCLLWYDPDGKSKYELLYVLYIVLQYCTKPNKMSITRHHAKLLHTVQYIYNKIAVQSYCTSVRLFRIFWASRFDRLLSKPIPSYSDTRITVGRNFRRAEELRDELGLIFVDNRPCPVMIWLSGSLYISGLEPQNTPSTILGKSVSHSLVLLRIFIWYGQLLIPYVIVVLTQIWSHYSVCIVSPSSTLHVICKRLDWLVNCTIQQLSNGDKSWLAQ